MGLNDVLRCPGLDAFLTVSPREVACPSCGSLVEIWSDEKKASCQACASVIQNTAMVGHGGLETAGSGSSHKYNQNMGSLVQAALSQGATRAGILLSAQIVVDDHLADLCRSNPPCENYGLSPGCPPHVAGPDGFRQWQTTGSHAIVMRIDIPQDVMFSSQRREIMALLHQITADVEHRAVAMGYVGSKAFAGGSCKKIFCRDHDACRVLTEQGECRHPQSARASMSGFGIDVAELMRSMGWPADEVLSDRPGKSDPMTWVAGLVLVIS